MPKESELIAWMRARARKSEDVLVGIGDDAAVFEPGRSSRLLACTDLSVEGVHFRAEWSEPCLIGRKALAVTLSDIAAMGGQARFALVSLALPGARTAGFAEEIIRGIFELAEASGVSVIGGDTSSSPGPLVIDTVALGECARAGAILRSGARAGDTIYVTGSLGASALGLLLLERGFRLGESSGAQQDGEEKLWRRLCLSKHLSPEPRLSMGAAIGKERLATAMIDVSDGLSTDLSHILEESGCGAIVDAGMIPIDESVLSLAPNNLWIDPLSLALNGGEEYELLFTAQGESRARLLDLSAAAGLPLSAIGEVVEGSGITLKTEGGDRALHPRGYEHLL